MNSPDIISLIEENKRLRKEIEELKSSPKAIDHGISQTVDHFGLLFESSPVGYLVYDREATILNCNPKFAKGLGRTREDLIGFNMFQNLKDDTLLNAIRMSIDEGRGYYEGEYSSVVTGKKVPVRGYFIRLHDPSSGWFRGVGFFEDLTLNFKSIKKAQVAEMDYRALFFNFQNAMFILDSMGCFLDVNPVMESLYGYPRNELKGKPLTSLLSIETGSSPTIRKHIKKALNGQPQHFDFWGIHKNGTKFPGEIRMSSGSYKGEVALIGLAHDVTERRRGEQLKEVVYQIARASQSVTNAFEFCELIRKKLKNLIDTENLFVALLNNRKDRLIIPYMHDKLDRLGEVPVEGTISALVLQEKRSMRLNLDEIYDLEQREVIGKVGSPCKSWLGVPLSVEDEVFGVLVVQSYEREDAFSDEDLKLLEFVSSQVAISIRHITSEERIHQLTQAIEQSPFAVMIVDLEYRVEYVNPVHRQITGFEPQKILGKPCRILTETHEAMGRKVNIKKETGGHSSWQGEIQIQNKSGLPIWISVSVSSIHSDDAKLSHYLVLLEDITEDHRLRQQLNQSQKMETIGTLAGGIAHDFNNLLTVVNGYAGMLMDDLEQLPEAQNRIIKILKAGTRAKEMTSKLLAFSRKQIFNAKPIDLNSIIEDQKDVLYRLIEEDIQIVLNLEPELSAIKADPSQIEQILMNLVVNARDAIWEAFESAKGKQSNKKLKEPKRIQIETSEIDLDDQFVLHHAGSRKGPHVKITVTDSGAGMDEALLEKIFEPFFTTKEQGKGTGLGLSTVYGIVKQNNGCVYVDSQPGQGTSVNVYWPITDEVLELQETPGTETPQYEQTGVERVLLVEDEDSVREFTASLLEKYGYKVQAAEHAEAALAWVDSLLDPEYYPEILITDMVMPGIGGRELAVKLKQIIPDVRVLFTSGYTNGQIVESGALQSGLNFLQKPYSPLELNLKVRDILDS